MAKFVFSLESLLKVKTIKKRKLEKDIAEAKQRLEEAQNLLDEIKAQKKAIQSKIKKNSSNGIKVFDLKEYRSYFQLLSEREEQQIAKCQQLEKKWKTIMAELVDIYNQIDVLERLKQEQYREYIYKLEKVEERALEDLVNFKFMTRSESING